MTRIQNKKSRGLTVLMVAVLVVMALGLTDLTDDNQAGTLVHEFGELLEGVEVEIQSIPNDTAPLPNTTDTMQTGKILADIAYIEAFDEVIKTQIL